MGQSQLMLGQYFQTQGYTTARAQGRVLHRAGDYQFCRLLASFS